MRSAAGRAFSVVIGANLLFLVVMAAAAPDRAVVSSRVRSAFATGDLDDADYLQWDSRRGMHQYNDCVVLQMLLDRNSSRLEWALAPLVRDAVPDRSSQCGLLRSIVMEGAGEMPPAFRYARYWHGYNAIAAVGLRALDLRHLRMVLSAAVWSGIGLLAFAAYRSTPRLRRTGLAIALTAALLWAVPFFAPNLTHGPGDALLLLALAGLSARPRVVRNPGVLVPFATAFGSVVVMFEMLTGQLPIAAAWFIALTLAIARDDSEGSDQSAPSLVLAALGGFGLGVIVTVLMKQGLASLVVEPDAGSAFLTQLRYYMGMPDFEAGWPGPLEPFGRLIRKSNVLTFGSSPAAYGVMVCVAVAWIVAVSRGWRDRRMPYGQDMLILAGASVIPLAWVFLLPLHTYIHAGFMVRMLVVPISLAPLALCWPRSQDVPIRDGARVDSWRRADDERPWNGPGRLAGIVATGRRRKS